jgi:hypothetical protein
MSFTNNADPGKDLFINVLPKGVGETDDPIERRLILEYGAVFTARGGVRPPSKVVFRNDAEVDAFQNGLQRSTVRIGEFDITLQTAAMEALVDASRSAKLRGLTVTPRGKEAAARSYSETVKLWASRVEPALDHWVIEGRITAVEAERLRALAPFDQVWEVLRLEDEEIWFSKDLSKTILHSVAPPGASQHLSMLALDMTEFDEPEVRKILARHGWFQTVTSDLPHFTFLGMSEDELPAAGLRRVESNGRHFWVPDM